MEKIKNEKVFVRMGGERMYTQNLKRQINKTQYETSKNVNITNERKTTRR